MKTSRILLKKEILAEGLKKHESVIEDFRTRIRQMTATDGNVNEEEYDSHAQSQKAETFTEVSLLSDQVQYAGHELNELRRLEWNIEEEPSRVAFGTVVVTDNGTFFVSSSIEQFSVNCELIFGLSVLSPLYKSMRGKKVGDSFKFGDKRYVIMEIF